MGESIVRVSAADLDLLHELQRVVHAEMKLLGSPEEVERLERRRENKAKRYSRDRLIREARESREHLLVEHGTDVEAFLSAADAHYEPAHVMEATG